MRRVLAFAALFLACNLPIIALNIAAWENGHLFETLPVFFTEPILLTPVVIGNLLFIVTLWTTLRRAEAP